MTIAVGSESSTLSRAWHHCTASLGLGCHKLVAALQAPVPRPSSCAPPPAGVTTLHCTALPEQPESLDLIPGTHRQQHRHHLPQPGFSAGAATATRSSPLTAANPNPSVADAAAPPSSWSASSPTDYSPSLLPRPLRLARLLLRSAVFETASQPGPTAPCVTNMISVPAGTQAMALFSRSLS